MALTYIFLTSPNGSLVTPQGKTYTANAAGVVTGVLPVDAPLVESTGQATSPVMLAATGATADRPNVIASPALTGAFNSVAPAPTLGFAFWDTTLSKTAYFVGTQRSTSGWVDFSGAVV